MVQCQTYSAPSGQTRILGKSKLQNNDHFLFSISLERIIFCTVFGSHIKNFKSFYAFFKLSSPTEVLENQNFK